MNSAPFFTDDGKDSGINQFMTILLVPNCYGLVDPVAICRAIIADPQIVPKTR